MLHSTHCPGEGDGEDGVRELEGPVHFGWRRGMLTCRREGGPGFCEMDGVGTLER